MKKYDENNWEDYSKTNGLNSHHEEYHKVVDPCSPDKRHNKTGTHIIMHSCFFFSIMKSGRSEPDHSRIETHLQHVR